MIYSNFANTSQLLCGDERGSDQTYPKVYSAVNCGVVYLEQALKVLSINSAKPAPNLKNSAETNDYILTYPLLDKDFQGQVLFVSYPGSRKPLPLVQGKVFLEGGLTFIVNQTIGPSLKGINSLDQLTQKYPSLENIPGSLEYLRQIQQYPILTITHTSLTTIPIHQSHQQPKIN